MDTGVDHAAVGWEQARRLTFVPFLADGRCALVPAGDRLVLPSGEVLAGEDPMLDTGLRVPLVTAGFRRQGFHPFAVEGDHVYVWCEGDDGYRGARPHAEVELWKGPAADRRAQRGHLCQAVDRDGSFLDVGCANGHLAESMVAWSAERGIRLEPFGVDLSAGLVAEARRRLPQWADRFWVGNALDWTAPGGRRFDFVHTLLDLVPEARTEQMVRHQLEQLVAPGGRLLASSYVPGRDRSRHAAAVLRRLGFRVDGVTHPAQVPGRPHPPTAWIQRP